MRAPSASFRFRSARAAWCTPAAVDALEASMLAGGATPEIYRYAADHAFFNQARGEVYDAACANAAWERSIAFLRRRLA